MELNQFFIMLHKRLILIVFIPVMMTALAGAASKWIINPVYASSSTLYIINQNSVSGDILTYEEMLTNQYLIKDFRELIKSKLITNAVIEELNIQDLTPTGLSGKILVDSKNDTRILEIKVEDSSPVRAALLTDKICQVFIKKSAELVQTNKIRVIDVAQVQNNPIKPNILLNMTLAFLLSLVATISMFYLLELLSETIKSSEDVDRYLGLNVLGTIPLFNIK